MLEEKLSQYLDTVTKAAAQAGPQVMQFAIQHEHWCGVGDITLGAFFLLLAFIGFGVCIGHKKHYIDNKEPGISICIISGFVGLIAFVIANIQLLNIWNWVAVFNPKIALFHDILTKLLNK